MLYRVMAEHLETFLQRTDQDPDRLSLPGFVRRELRAFLDCGILAKGLCRVHCSECGRDDVVAFSCKGRGFCPSCGARRMSDTAAWLVDRVLPCVPVRQWVLSLPGRVRFLCAREPEVCRGVRRILVRAISSFYCRRVGVAGRIRTGCVAFTQRFDSAAGTRTTLAWAGRVRLNVHFHTLWPDGAFEFGSWNDRAIFHEAPAPTGAEVAALARALEHRIDRWLRKRGYLEDEPELDAGDVLVAAAVQGRVPFGEGAGSLDPRLRGDPPEARAAAKGKLCASSGGYSLHGGVRIPGGAREQLEKLCRYAARPPVVHERLKLSRDGRKVVYGFKRRWADGSTHVVMDPLVCVSRLAALVPRPRVNLTTYHGVFAPAASGRELVVPEVEEEPEEERTCDHDPSGTGEQETRRPRRRYSWAELMKRLAFAKDVLVCPECGGLRRVQAMVLEAAALDRILRHLGLPAERPSIAPARGPPQQMLPGWE